MNSKYFVFYKNVSFLQALESFTLYRSVCVHAWCVHSQILCVAWPSYLFRFLYFDFSRGIWTGETDHHTAVTCASFSRPSTLPFSTPPRGSTRFSPPKKVKEDAQTSLCDIAFAVGSAPKPRSIAPCRWRCNLCIDQRASRELAAAPECPCAAIGNGRSSKIRKTRKKREEECEDEQVDSNLFVRLESDCRILTNVASDDSQFIFMSISSRIFASS